MNNAFMAMAIGAAVLLSSAADASAATCRVIGKKTECSSTTSVKSSSSSSLGALSLSNTRASSAIASAGSGRTSSILNQSSKKTKNRRKVASVGLSLGNVMTQNPIRPVRVVNQVPPAQSLVATPVPPAALLFGTALLGIGFMARRRGASAPSA